MGAEKFVHPSIDELLAKLTRVKCTQCNIEIDKHPDDENYTISKKIVCRDCYYTVLGNEIEKHPIYNPFKKSRLALRSNL